MFKRLFKRKKKLSWDQLTSEQKFFYMIMRPKKKDPHFDD